MARVQIADVTVHDFQMPNSTSRRKDAVPICQFCGSVATKVAEGHMDNGIAFTELCCDTEAEQFEKKLFPRIRVHNQFIDQKPITEEVTMSLPNAAPKPSQKATKSANSATKTSKNGKSKFVMPEKKTAKAPKEAGFNRCDWFRQQVKAKLTVEKVLANAKKEKGFSDRKNLDAYVKMMYRWAKSAK